MRKILILGGLMAAAILTGAGASTAQTADRVDLTRGGHWWIGYAANAPQQLVGLGTVVLMPGLGGWGLYADVKLTSNSPARESFRSDLTPADAEAFGDASFGQRSAWTNVNAAVVKALGPEFALYAGAGLGTRTMYQQYTDDTRTRSETGEYWVEDDAESGTFANGLAGAFFRLSNRFVFQFGAEAAPAGFTAGMHIILR